MLFYQNKFQVAVHSFSYVRPQMHSNAPPYPLMTQQGNNNMDHKQRIIQSGLRSGNKNYQVSSKHQPKTKCKMNEFIFHPHVQQTVKLA